MITSSPAFAEARRLNRSAIGGVKLEPTLDLVEAARIMAGQIQQQSQRVWRVDIPVDLLQTGRVADVERWYDRFHRQFLAYWNLHSAQIDPPWTAVTGYYCAFFGAQTLLGMLGMGARSFPQLGVLPDGLYRLTETPSPYANHARVELRKQGGGSHRALWTQLVGILDALLAIPGNDQGTDLALRSLRQISLGPPALAATRNRINYSIDFSPATVGRWKSEFKQCTSVDELEHRLQHIAPSHDAHRFEFVALTTGYLVRALYDDYVARGKSLDLRPRKQRRAVAAAAGPDHPASAWF